MKITRQFCQTPNEPYANIRFISRTSKIVEASGKIVQESSTVLAPENWSQVAVDILAQKYFRRTGIPDRLTTVHEDGVPTWLQRQVPAHDAEFTGEHDARQVFHRLAGCWTYWGWKAGYFDSEDDAKAYYDEMRAMLAAQVGAPNSPQWFNTGLHWAYGIEGRAQGHFYVDPFTGELTKSTDAYSRATPFACFPAGTLISTETGFKPIEEIQPGENVVTHLGRMRPVLATQSRLAQDLVRITAHGYSADPLACTPEHPLYVIPNAYASYVYLTGQRRIDKRNTLTPQWIKAGDVKPGDAIILSYPEETKREIPAFDLAEYIADRESSAHFDVSDDLIVSRYAKKTLPVRRVVSLENPKSARLLGHWLGDGSLLTLGHMKHVHGISFVFNKNDMWQVDEIRGLMASTFGLDGLPESYEDQGWMTLRYNSTPVARWFLEHCGRYSYGKRVPTFLFGMSKAHRLEFLAGLWNADGCKTSRTKAVDLHWDFTNRILAHGVVRVMRSLSFRPTLSGGEIKPGGTRPHYRITLRATTCPELTAMVSVNTDCAPNPLLYTHAFGVHRGARISKVERIPFNGMVYNLQAQEDETYVANGFVVHNCFIGSIDDTLVEHNGIFDFVTKEARIFKFGSGSGANFSKLRAAGEPLSGGGKSSGLMSWLRIADRAAGAIKSGGTTRRAAKMVVLDADHPDILEFVSWKANEEQKVANLVAGSIVFQKKINAVMAAAHDQSVPFEDRLLLDANTGLAAALADALSYGIPQGCLQQALDLAKQGTTSIEIAPMDVDWNGEAYLTVSGQNSNNSISIPNAFFHALENDGSWSLKRRTDGAVTMTLDARELWDHIALSAWKCADPGILYIDTMNEWHTCAASGRINATNPCGEYVFIDDTSCNLASLKLTAFYDNAAGTFDIASFEHAVRLWTLTLEIAVVMGQLPNAAYAQNTYDFRTLGLGYADIGTLLMRMGLPYDSENGRNWAAAITALLGGASYRTSAEIAAEVGAFAKYPENAESMLRVIRNHRRAAHGAFAHQFENLTVAPVTYTPIAANADVWNAARTSWDDAERLGELYGFRNAQSTLIAPTGTIGLLMDCDTTGIEPDFSLVKFKKLAGGGYFKIVNQSIRPALEHLGYDDTQIREIENYAIGTGKLSVDDVGLLADAGATPDIIDMIERALPTAMSLDMAAGVADFDLSSIDAARLSAISDRICGTMTLEGAPHLSPDDLPVFDCATPCGLKGTRAISPRAHVDMLGAVQPYLSGGVSKTINMPQATTVAEVQELYRYAHGRMVKAVALYRDGSKLSQPLSGKYVLPKALLDNPIAIAEKIVYRYLAEKRSMPGRRNGYTQKFKIGGHKIYLKTGEYNDQSLGEIFIDAGKEGAAFKALLNNFAVAVSIGLQHGVPIEEFVEAYTFTKFEPNGPIVGHDRIKNCTSILDAIFRDLAVNYLDRDDLAHISKEDISPTAETIPALAMAPSTIVRTAAHSSNGVSPRLDAQRLSKAKGYTGNACTECGQLTMVRNGSCEKCDSCGMTSGCS